MSTLKQRVARKLAIRDSRPSEPVAQLQLIQTYRAEALEPRRLTDYGFSIYSQTDEDGILLYLFAVLGATNRQCAEICAGDGMECNTANLLINHGWGGLLVDGDEENVQRARAFYATKRETRIYPPLCVQAWVTRDNVNDLLTSNRLAGDIDLLSLDLDGVDYWIWNAITAVSPRVVVVEYQDILGPDRSWTVPYADDFSAARYSMTRGMPNFAGASLRAFTNLAHEKGYRLVGTNRLGFNAFFVRNELGGNLVPEVPVEACFTHPKVQQGMRERFPLVAHAPWEVV
jgi:hypothetical protein